MGGHILSDNTGPEVSAPRRAQAPPETKKKEMGALACVTVTKAFVKVWFHNLMQEETQPNGRENLMPKKIIPNESQLKYLRSISDRCLAEEEDKLLEGKASQEQINTEPLREGLLGPPGTGKSECLKWTFCFFTECMGWEHGVQFQFCAPQHTMAAVIGGNVLPCHPLATRRITNCLQPYPKRIRNSTGARSGTVNRHGITN